MAEVVVSWDRAIALQPGQQSKTPSEMKDINSHNLYFKIKILLEIRKERKKEIYKQMKDSLVNMWNPASTKIQQLAWCSGTHL